MGWDLLAVRWLIGVVVYFATFVVLMDVFLMEVDWPLILKSAILFSLVVSTISIVQMWKKNAKSLPYYDTVFASGIAGLLLIGTMPSDERSFGWWSLSSLLLIGMTVAVGVAGRWVYAAVTSRIRRVIRERSMGSDAR